MSQPTTNPEKQSRASQTQEAAKETANRVAHSAAEMTQQYAQHYVSEPAKDLFTLAKEYARDNPDVAATWCFALGVIVGWKLKP